MSLFSRIFGKKYPVEWEGPFVNARPKYRAGELVEGCLDLIATDTDYRFFVDGENYNARYDSEKGYVVSFVMPPHPVKVGYTMKNTMVFEPFGPEPEPETEPETAVGSEPQSEPETETVYLAGGCFWGIEKLFEQVPGVLKTEVGYANGPDRAPSYREVCQNSGHAETVRIDYDTRRLTFGELLELYFKVIDPLSVNKQGEDSGVQYRTGIYYTDEAGQLPLITEFVRRQEEKLGAKLAVEVGPIINFFPAEEYHQKYLDKNPGGYCHIDMSVLKKQ